MGKASRRKRIERARRADPLPVRLARAASEILVPEFFTPDCCVNATWVAVEVLRRFGVEADAYHCHVLVANPTFLALVKREGALRDSAQARRWQEAGAWMLDVDEREEGDGRYPGHVVCVADGYLIDLSAGQFNRPRKGIDVPAAFAAKIPDGFVRGVTCEAEINGSMLAYTVRPEIDAFRVASGFDPSPNNLDAAEAVFARMS
jgi:hypothetical protein